jgi:hypothetical protein
MIASVGSRLPWRLYSEGLRECKHIEEDYFSLFKNILVYSSFLLQKVYNALFQ